MRWALLPFPLLWGSVLSVVNFLAAVAVRFLLSLRACLYCIRVLVWNSKWVLLVWAASVSLDSRLIWLFRTYQGQPDMIRKSFRLMSLLSPHTLTALVLWPHCKFCCHTLFKDSSTSTMTAAVVCSVSRWLADGFGSNCLLKLWAKGSAYSSAVIFVSFRTLIERLGLDSFLNKFTVIAQVAVIVQLIYFFLVPLVVLVFSRPCLLFLVNRFKECFTFESSVW